MQFQNEEGNLSNATAVAVRNESNWPPDLGNGYRKPLCFADPHEKFERSILCTSCNTACYSFSKLHQHMIECGNSRFNPR